jgi:TonB-linked SusC/RagA family outer membrane protein
MLLLYISLLQLYANPSYSQQEVMSMTVKHEKVLDVLKKIEQNSELKFFFSPKTINLDRRVTLKVNNQSVNQILESLFEGTNVSYKQVDDTIILRNLTGKAKQNNERKITGVVTDENGESLPGASIIVKGTTVGVVTNIDGKYSLSIPANATTLQFSFVGMKTEEVEIGSQNTVNVVLKTDAVGLDEVVAIGYGVAKKSDLTGAVGSVKGGTVAERQTTQLSTALQGAISGVMVTRNNNAPGATASIRIRGITTIGESNPLVIVDGVPVGSINDVNPNDIENISVLKDAASAAIYGSRAAAGVILVTTKRAKAGDLKLEYSFSYGFDKPTALPEYVDAKRYMQMVNELRWNDNGNNDNMYPTYPKETIENYDQLNAENPNEYPNTDWVGLILKDSAPKQTHAVSVAAGGKAIKTNASFAYDKIGALYEGRQYERYTARFNNDVKINDYISATIDLSVKRTVSESPSIDPMYGMFISAPVYPAVWSDGRIASGKSGNNVYGQLLNGGYNESFGTVLNGKGAIHFTPFKGFKLSAVVSPSYYFGKKKEFRLKVPYYAADDPTNYVGTLQWGRSTKVTEKRSDNNKTTTQFLATYLTELGGHNINLMAGYENYYAFYEDLAAGRDEYELTSFPYLDLGPLEYRTNSGSAYENAYRSYFGRVMYNYQNRYYLQANFRVDGSSRFHKDHRWGQFPSFSAGWVASEEGFMADLKQHISFLKLRASWGRLGNERIGNYPYQSTIGFSNALFYEGTNVVSAQTAAQWEYAIKDISWETTESFDVGLDLGFLDNHLRVTGDYYLKNTKDMLLKLEIPDYLGFGNPSQNTGKMKTHGWEAEVNYHNNIGDLKYSVSFNISDFKSKMGDLGGTEFLGSQVKKEGSEFNEWYGYVSDGLFQTQEEVDNSAVLNTKTKPGDIKYKDISGPEGVPDGKISPEYDKVLLGGSLPRYMYGANIQLSYKNFDLGIVLQGVGKQNSVKHSNMVRPLQENWGSIPALIDGNYWSVNNTEEQNLNAEFPRLSSNASGNNYTMSDYWLFNGGYLRLKNISLGYRIPEKVCNILHLRGARVFTNVSDLFTIDNYPKGWDPEVASSGYPITTSIIFGLSVKF